MTRQVFTNSMTAHVWASQSQTRGRSNNGNFYFEGRCLYSYGPHYVCGFAAPGGLWLLNGDDSSMTTKGKHMNAARWAVDYGRGAFANCFTVPGLTRLVDVWQPRYGQSGYTGPETVRRLAQHLESGGGAFWPGAEAATAIYRAAGATEAEAARRGRAGADRVARAIAKAEAREAKREADQNARLARQIAKGDPSDTQADVRDKLARAVEAGQWEAQRLEAEAAELGREAFRCAKAAKAKGWTRIAAACLDHHKAARIEIRRFESARARYAERSAIRRDLRTIRESPDQIRQFWALNPEAVDGAKVADYTKAINSSEQGARGFAALAAALGRVADSRYAVATWGLGSLGAARREAEAAYDVAESLRIRAGHLQTEWQAEARAEWMAGGNPSTWQFGRLCDERGAALLRAEGVERDDSGAIVGGTLRTSWGATVPLPHAIRAFRFLRHCRDTSTEWRANGHALRVGHFRVDHVDTEGNFVAGCHRISWAEAARVAEGLGLAELAGADTTEPTRGVA